MFFSIVPLNLFQKDSRDFLLIEINLQYMIT